jgi:chemotaxis protein histidine kinase CheA
MSDPFAQRLAAVRLRFVAQFNGRVDVIESAILQSGSEDRLDNLVFARREAHSLCGVGHTLGFIGTGKAAQCIEKLLDIALKSERTITDNEIPSLRQGIALLRSTAVGEMYRAGARSSPTL